jgi:hypothetical protein
MRTSALDHIVPYRIGARAQCIALHHSGLYVRRCNTNHTQVAAERAEGAWTVVTRARAGRAQGLEQSMHGIRQIKECEQKRQDK